MPLPTLPRLPRTALWAAGLLSLPGLLWSDDIAALQPFTVIGSKDSVFDIPGTAYYLDDTELDTFATGDITQALRQMPGIYVRPEDGYGLFPNVSLRGVNPGRMSKVTVMEDGILTAPAPYAAPAAYYSPSLARMHALEVQMGSSQIRFGPHTTGGVINYLSTPVPAEQSGFAQLMYGSDDDRRVHAWYGDAMTLGDGRLQFLIEGYYREVDGFKSLNGTQTSAGGGDTGFRNVDSTLKLRWTPDAEGRHWFEVKTGYLDKEANETYLGLSAQDFANDPFQRYPATRDDRISTHQWRNYIRHHFEINADALLTTTAYHSRFHRNWFKLNNLQAWDADGDGTIDDTGGISLGEALAKAEGGRPLEVLQGVRAGQYELRANNRNYQLSGLQSILNWEIYAGDLRHLIEAGIRYHTDEIRRFQEDTQVFQAADGSIVDRVPDGPGSGGNRLQVARAWAFHLEDAIRMGPWTVTPGFRYEHIRGEYTDFVSNATNTPATVAARTFGVWAAGISAEYRWDEARQAFAGIHRGFSVPAPRTAARPGRELDEETSINVEVGIRHAGPAGTYGEVILFNTAFEDLITIDNVGTGSSNPQNIGEATARGLELLAVANPVGALDWGFQTPLRLALTYTDATFDSPSTDTDPESIFSGAEVGNRFPYIPEWQASFRAGVETEIWSLTALASYTDATFGTASNTREQRDPQGNRDSRYGYIEGLFTVDLNASWQLNAGTRLFAIATNVLDETALVSRLPEGPRPNAPRAVHVGVAWTF